MQGNIIPYPVARHPQLNPTEPTLGEMRIAFRATQQALRQLQCFPQAALNLASFPYADDWGHADIDRALELLEREVATLKVMRQNYRASRTRFSTGEECA